MLGAGADRGGDPPPVRGGWRRPGWIESHPRSRRYASSSVSPRPASRARADSRPCQSAQGGLQRPRPTGRPHLGDQRGDLLHQVAAPPELMCHTGVPHVGLVVDAVAVPRVAARMYQPGALPLAQRRGSVVPSSPACQRPDEPAGQARTPRWARTPQWSSRGGRAPRPGGSAGRRGAARDSRRRGAAPRCSICRRFTARMIDVAVWWPWPGTTARNARRAPRVQRGTGAIAVGVRPAAGRMPASS